MKQPIPFGKYFLLERVNVGGMAEVFKAKATGVEGFERLVAVKRILPSIAEDEEFITMFIDEAKIAVQLTHASIAQIFDLGKVDDSFFIALEYVHGKDLRAIFNRARSRSEQIPIPMACYATMKVCEGLDYAHNKRDATGGSLNLVHRDVSPQNLLVSYEGEVKIIDFGIAKAAGKAGKTQAGILKGKFGYMSPEQVQGMEIDRRSDIFGLGICLYELLTGERLFIAESDFATLEKVKNVDIMPPSTYNRRIPEELEQIVLKALARDRERRHQTAMALHDELQSFMYSSGNFFGRKDLSMYMHRAFAEEIDRESARDQEYASLPAPPMEHDTGLSAFEEIDPVSAVSALNVEPLSAPMPMRAPQPRAPSAPARYPTSPGLPRKSTLLGIPPATNPARVSVPPRPSVPPMVPRPQSIPPSASRPPAAPAPGLDMGWDDEELSTQIYDRPEDATPAPMSPPGAFTPPPSYASPAHGLAAQATPSQPMHVPTPVPRSYTPPMGVPAAPGVPSPFGPGAMPPDTREVALEAAQWSSGNRRSMAWAGVGVVAIVCAIVVGLVLFKPPAFGTLHISTVPRDAQLMVDGKPVPGSSPFVVSEMAPATTHDVQVSKVGYRTWTGKVEVQPDQTLQLPDVELDALESGFALDSVPSGASVFVDGKKLDRTTPVRVTELKAGDHQIRLESEGYGPWESSLHVTLGNVLDLPNAQLTPTTPEAGAQAPAREVAASKDERPRHRVAPIRRRSTRPTPVAVAPPPARDDEPAPPPERDDEPAAGGGTGTLRVQTRPWSKVFVDGSLIGNTPQMAISLSSGGHTVTFVNEDFGIRKTIRVSIKSGEVLTRVLNLAE